MTMQTFIKQLCEHCGIESETVEISVEEDEKVMTVQLALPEEDSGLFIGYRGETLSSLQRILRLTFQNELGDKKCVLNINEYREQREDKLKQMADSAAQKVLDTGREYVFNAFLPSYERFLIHSYISENQDFSELESVSEGEGKNRVLTIRKKSN